MHAPSHCLSLAILLFLQLCPPCQCSISAPLDHKPLLSFNSTWEILGPFQIGTREATWGADPLEFEGGFRNLEYDSQASFRSSLPTTGTAHWNLTTAKTLSGSASANASLSISYSNVDWDFLKTIYGWASVQYQTWARGELIVGGEDTQHIILHTDAILECWINDTHYFGGDYYSYRNAPPVLHLGPGNHRIDLRLARDARAFGGILEPITGVVVAVEQVTGNLNLAKPGILMSDVIDGELATPHGSVTLRNSGTQDIEITGIHAANVSTSASTSYSLLGLDTGSQMPIARGANDLAPEQVTDDNAESAHEPSIVIVAGQTRPVAFNITLPSHNASSLAYNITYRTVGSNKQSNLEVTQDLNYVSVYDPHKITFLHPGGMVSYAMLRPPAKNASCRHEQKRLPVLLAMHGAGLEADNPMVPGALRPVSDLCSWTVFPTGVTPWSGDDWHNWGFADVEAAIEAIPGWILYGNWSGPGVDTNRWIVSGHSNGGQGTWYALTHRPDKVLAAAPVSGYASIQKYVPYEFWQPADPRRTSVVSASLNSYRHEMLMANAQGIPIRQQHGEVDDNVPAYHSRFLSQQLRLAGANSSYNEVPDQNHYWDGVMTTPPLVDFYYNFTRSTEELPRELDEFNIVVGDPGDMGSKGGVRVTQLEDPGQYGRVHVRGRRVKTSNVLGIEFGHPFWTDTVVVDGQTLDLAGAAANTGSTIQARLSGNSWVINTVGTTDESTDRRGRQLGSMTAILRTHGPIIIKHPGTVHASHLALQVSRNLYQYFHADTVILSDIADTASANATGNVIHLSIGDGLTSADPDFPIQASTSGASLRDSRGREQLYDNSQGAAWLRPLDGERLELVLWGADEEGLRQAARLVPMLTGVGQPDFVILGEETKWKGIEGALALGFFNSQWQVTASSFVS
ncbi:uncharacterized protein M421DRAFT_67357 [Didymella exigua CBS 183.55]|uniref:Peptidase S9 prolyl oligopeptidase catalytic domain-containing protein n=1 Tax=Didymella exigua CBS 183.55 TaxID=1150837 RepID=A0A6A5RGM7_9PLEO|nr:uncharacterized protein M421DRAFT_67357 [Didymella exigua CBS 183.55]KAF1926669.1 hypothetical protein M421DRAFT_67357 [Didymella exigua CBS 183.55]